MVILKGSYFLIIFQVNFGVKWLRFIVQYSLDSFKPVFKVCFDGSYVNFLFIVELVWRDLYFVNDIWDNCSCFCYWRCPQSQRYCLRLSSCDYLKLILCFSYNCNLFWFCFYWRCYYKSGSLGNVGLTSLKNIFRFLQKHFLLNEGLNHMVFFLYLLCF